MLAACLNALTLVVAGSLAAPTTPVVAPPPASGPVAAGTPATAAPPTAAPPPTTAAPTTTLPPPGPAPGPTPVAPPDDGGWGAEDETPTAGTAPVATTAPTTGYQAPPPPDPALLQRNRQLSAQMQRGERWLIAGRVGAPLSFLHMLVGIGMLGSYGARRRAAAYDDDSGIRHPPSQGLLIGGAVVTTLGVAALGASIYAAVHGFRLMKHARAGQFVLRAGPRHAGLGVRGRF